ncbi:hypothetical protein ACVW1A_002875 [Bradyrhizobium sp. LB1.3]
MDKVKAETWAAELKDKDVAGYTIHSLIDFGKSAAVFRASRSGATVALKIFDDELIERYGDKTQLARIDRELTLVGKRHPNMVAILDGGFDKRTGNHFIVMEYLAGKSLEKCLSAIPEANVPMLIEQLASCCEYLETLSLVHRDIKPANIAILNDYSRLVLLDFGVMKPVGEVGVTDVGGIQSFVGTLQYSSPEFLLRKEEDTIQGWRALSLYQIGGVLHDLVMRRPLFHEYANPYARLVIAVQNDQPTVASTTVPSYLVEACKSALVKDWRTRLQLIGWKSFSPPGKTGVGLDARERVIRRSILNDAMAVPQVVIGTGAGELVEAVINLLKVEVRRVRNSNAAVFPPLSVTRIPADGNILTVTLRSEPQQGLPVGLTMEVGVNVLDETAQAVRIGLCAWLGSPASKPATMKMTEAFEGIFTPATLSGMIEDAMYLALDRAQIECSGDEGVAISLSDLEAGV